MITILTKRESTAVPAERAIRNNSHVESEILQSAHERLHASSIYELKKVRCELHEGTLFLCGTVSSFYHKQLAQEAVKALAATTRIVNQLDVVTRIEQRQEDREWDDLSATPCSRKAK